MDDLRERVGLGVAGNFTGHLDQAGETPFFQGVAAESGAPKGVFPFHLPGLAGHFLGVDPFTHDLQRLHADGYDVQVEPEAALLVDLEWNGDTLAGIRPTAVAAYNDGSLRRKDVKVISHKKNWGAGTKGIAKTALPVVNFEPGAELDRYRLACHLKRDGEWRAYGVESPLGEYTYFHGRLLDWLVEKINHQVEGGPLENLSELLGRCGRPAKGVVSVGATRYTEYGESTFLKDGDEVLVALFDPRKVDAGGLRAVMEGEAEPEGMSLLRQRVVGPDAS